MWIIYCIQGVVERRLWDRREDSSADNNDVDRKVV